MLFLQPCPTYHVVFLFLCFDVEVDITVLIQYVVNLVIFCKNALIMGQGL